MFDNTPAQVPLTPRQRTLLCAADIIETVGWTKGATEDHLGRVCVQGALTMAIFGHARGPSTTIAANYDKRMHLLTTTISQIEQYLRAGPWGETKTNMVGWNDSRDTTVHEVVNVLRGAATPVA